jgi:hypothetical protein
MQGLQVTPFGAEMVELAPVFRRDDNIQVRETGQRRLDHPNSVVEVVGDIYRPLRINRDAAGVIQLSIGRRAPVTSVQTLPQWTCGSIARDCDNGAIREDLTNAVILGLRNQETPCCVNRQCPGTLEACRGGRAPIAQIPRGTRTRNSGNNAAWRHLPHAMIERVGDKDIPLGVNCHSRRMIEMRSGCGASVSGKSDDADASDSRNRASRINFPDTLTIGISNIEITDTVKRYTDGILELRAGRWSSISVVPSNTRPRDGRDDAVRTDPADPLIRVIGKENVAGAINRDPPRTVELCTRRRPSIASITE